MNQNVKHISARKRDFEGRKRNTGVVPNYLKFVNTYSIWKGSISCSADRP